MKSRHVLGPVAAAAVLAGCQSLPAGPPAVDAPAPAAETLALARQHYVRGNVFALQSELARLAGKDDPQVQLYRAGLQNAFRQFDAADATLAALETDPAIQADTSLRALAKRERYLHHALQGDFGRALETIQSFDEDELDSLPAGWRDSIMSALGFLPFLAGIPLPVIDAREGEAVVMAPFDEAIGAWMLDGTVNGQPARLAMDTGASATLIRESSAERFGLKRVGSDGVMRNLVGETAIVPFAAADEITFGGVRYQNALILVVPDSQFGDHDFDALLSHTVVAALGRFALDPASGRIERQGGAQQDGAEPNMAVVNTSLMTGVRLGDSEQACLLDTAADSAISRRLFNDFEEALGLRAVEREGGGDIFPGSDAPVHLPVVEQIRMVAGGTGVNMGQVVEILPAETLADEEVPCIIGRNVMRGMARVDFDFETMQVRFTP